MEEIKSTYPGRQYGLVAGIPIDLVDWPTVRQVVCNWAIAREARQVCVCDVHSVITAGRNGSHRKVIEEADMVTADGAPVAWTLRRKGFSGQTRINGPDMMWHLCADAPRRGIKVGLFGSAPETLERLRAVMEKTFPQLDISYCVSPPFRQLTHDEDNEICDSINRSGVGLLFVSLGCPKQEKWISEHRGRIHAVMIGVGAAFDYHAGAVLRAPLWMQSNGLEWLHRLWSEPRRLWKRYLINNSQFIIRTLYDWFSGEFDKAKAISNEVPRSGGVRKSGK
ncbi:WecB/TagA/CpsF family glycosyltransferase [Nitrosovibrio sp. Nv6]|uniref:WecB/TagA/CpsF family glycosyltransferase n=1 Tax=Nitrosovibrio sp. Nv6 TaxID=1855340 RepID=UPI0008AC712D|nr:WecB/TagA/CpsF family glycosyltransferase [Nitrosovibrio sp. Nv6]SEP35646.1 N-acetylglucosaminyldiphosphoundecaprenol N-acetyl-beta-D-mannosaminyltransferase [Nitrosovibrio sp. Nv6]